MKLLPHQKRMMKIIKNPNAKLFLHYRRGKSRAGLLLQENTKKGTREMKNIDVLKLADEVEMWGEDLLALNMKGGIPVVQGAKMLRQQADLIRNLRKSLGFKNSGYETINLTPQLELTDEEIIELLAELEHEQWMKWADTIMQTEKISDSRFARWASCMIPYADLTEEMKEFDREWARKALAILRKAQEK